MVGKESTWGHFMEDQPWFRAEYPIAKVVVFGNGMVMVFDKDGKQLPQYQGPKSEVAADILAHSHFTRFKGGTEFYMGNVKIDPAFAGELLR